MKTLKTYLWALLILPLLISCDRDVYVVRNGQKVLFQYERSDFAWGRYQVGWFIDSEGYVRAYKYPEQWKYQDQTNHISKADMDANLLYADSVCFKIDAQMLSKKVALIQKASEGKLSDPIGRMADYGELTYSCFTFDTTTQKYQVVLLSETGDFDMENTSKEAKALFEWLKEVNDQVFP